jgi:antitoxin (DNA-binding transcriptional repressor) of toxin-antitoxin stability system
MATYDLPYLREHLRELFEEARHGEDVTIVRSDGRSCQLLPLANVKDQASDASECNIVDLEALCAPAAA